MATRSRNSNFYSVESNLGRILSDSRTPSDATNPLQDTDKEGHFAALRATNL